MNFDKAFDLLISHEGGFTEDPDDPGNWTGGQKGRGVLKGTKFGISCASYPDLDIENLTLQDAKAIYRSDWWDRLRLDELDPVIRFSIFDAAVNSGAGQAARWMQRAVGVADDGRIGPITMAAIRSTDPEALAARINGHRLLFMTRLSIWPKYSGGWAARVAKNLIDVGAQ